MIPKVIHYVWLGGAPLSPLAERCIESWRTYCPDYEIVRWDETSFDISANRYCREAYEARKWAFASDYVRLWVLVNHGGIYMDTDVELVGNLDEFLDNEAFSGFEAEDRVPTGLMASVAGQEFFSDLLKQYENQSFVRADGSLDLTTNVTRISDACRSAGLVFNNRKQTVRGFTLYPTDVFCPKDWLTKQINVTPNTRAIHHFDGSWAGPGRRIKHSIMRVLGPRGVRLVRRLRGEAS